MINRTSLALTIVLNQWFPLTRKLEVCLTRLVGFAEKYGMKIAKNGPGRANWAIIWVTRANLIV